MAHSLLQQNNINEEDLKRIKKRIYIVGKFSAEVGMGPYLFQKGTTPSAHYDKSNVYQLSFDNFVTALKPSLSEIYNKENRFSKVGDYLDYFELVCDKTTADSKAIPIDKNNYFFQRASSSSKHPKFKTDKPNFKTSLIGENATKDIGEGVFTQVRESLNDFCNFQYQHVELIKWMELVFQHNSEKLAMPVTYSAGGVLPINFAQAFIDYLYSNQNAPFTTKGLDFKIDPWETGLNSDGSIEETFDRTFCTQVTQFRKFLLNANANDGFSSPDGITFTPLKQFDAKLRVEFNKSRESYNVLQQILKSKVLLSNILLWALSRFDDVIPGEFANSNEKNKKIEEAIFSGLSDKAGQVVLKAPDQRFADDISQERTKKEFDNNLFQTLQYVAKKTKGEDAATTQSLYEGLSPEFQKSAQGLLSSPEKASVISNIFDKGETQARTVISAMKNILADDLLGEVFRGPGLSYESLKTRVRGLDENLFMTLAVYTATNNQHDREALLQGLLKNIGYIDQNKKTSGQANPAEKLENAFQQLLMNGVDVVVQMMNNSEVNTNVEAVLRSKLNGQVLQDLHLAYKSNGVSASSPLIGTPLDKTGIKTGEAAKASNIDDSVINSLLEGTLSKIRTADKKKLADSIDKAIKQKQNLDKAYTEVKLETKLKEYCSKPDAKDDVERKTNEKEISEILREDLVYYHQNLAELYKTHKTADNFKEYRNKVEAQTLANLLIQLKDSLDLDNEKRRGTNMLDMLLDMVETLDRNEPDLKDFFAQKSLTKYIKKEIFNNGGNGYRALVNVLEVQSERSLKNIVQYVSELKGVNYLFDYINTNAAGQAEVVVFNCTHTEFSDWLTSQLQLPSKRFLDPVSVDKSQFPACIVMSELAFGNEAGNGALSNKETFLQSLKQDSCYINSQSVQIVPPVILSTGSDKYDKAAYFKEDVLNKVMAPVLLLDPCLALNSNDDTNFPTILSSAYLFAAELLGPSAGEQENEKDGLLREFSVNKESKGRCRVLWRGNLKISKNFQKIISPGTPFSKDFSYAFDADFFLYIIAIIRTGIRFNGDAWQPSKHLQLLLPFCYNAFDNGYELYPNEMVQLNGLLVNSQPSDWSLCFSGKPQNPDSTLLGVSYKSEIPKIAAVPAANAAPVAEATSQKVFDAEWFKAQTNVFNFLTP